MNLMLLAGGIAVAAICLIAFLLMATRQRSAADNGAPKAKTSAGTVRRPSAPQKRQAEAEKSRNGAMLMPGPNCCWAVRQLVDKWYPEGEIPRLPLDACEKISTCKCHYRNTPDRRVKPRRTQPDRRDDIRFETSTDRRSGDDRRRGEDNWKISV